MIAAAITDEDRTGIEANLYRLKKRFSSVTALDFFASPGREPAETVMEQLEARLKEARRKPQADEAETEKRDLGNLPRANMGYQERCVRGPHSMCVADPPFHRS